MIGVAISAIALGVIAFQVKAISDQTKTQKQQDDISRADRYVTEYQNIRKITHKLRQQNKKMSISQICDAIDNDEDTRSEWYAMMEYFERLGALVALGTIDKRFILKTLDAVIVDAWELSEPVIKELSKRDKDDLIFELFEDLYKAAKDSASKKQN
ncbi:MAG: DUF4760 domain-containing protein [Candidatus Lambdaproteobacteria bacterium]|nr:DUF4760 domain-containing protein [Candidatus Lambdaproteobacteria bacterium]